MLFLWKPLVWVANLTAFLVICHLYLSDSSSSVSVIFAELDPSLLLYSGASTIMVVEGSQLSLLFFWRVDGAQGSLLFVIYPILPLNLTWLWYSLMCSSHSHSPSDFVISNIFDISASNLLEGLRWYFSYCLIRQVKRYIAFFSGKRGKLSFAQRPVSSLYTIETLSFFGLVLSSKK